MAVAVAVCAGVAATAAGSAAMAEDNEVSVRSNSIREVLSGYQEDPLVLSTTGTGTFTARINNAAQRIEYRLTYADLEGTVVQAHIHIGGHSQSGGISVFLCTNAGNGPAGTQACPAAPGVITGTIAAANVIGPTGQGIAAGEYAELVRAIRAGVTYVNVHSTMYPGGEIRAQLGRHHH